MALDGTINNEKSMEIQYMFGSDAAERLGKQIIF